MTSRIPSPCIFEKVCFAFILWLAVTPSQNSAGLVFSMVFKIPYIWDCQKSAWFLSLCNWPIFSLWKLLRHTVYFWYLKFSWSLFRCVGLFVLLYLNIARQSFYATKTSVFLFSSGYISSIVLIIFFPLVCLLVHLIVKVKYLDGFTVYANSELKFLYFFLGRWVLFMVEDPALGPWAGIFKLKEKKSVSTGF